MDVLLLYRFIRLLLHGLSQYLGLKSKSKLSKKVGVTVCSQCILWIRNPLVDALRDNSCPIDQQMIADRTTWMALNRDNILINQQS